MKGLTEGKAKGVAAVPMADIKTLAAACEKTEWGTNVSDTIKQYAGEYKFDLAANLLYAAKSPDLSAEVQSLKAANPSAMLFASYTSDAILMIKTLQSMKASPKILWGQDAGFEAPEFVTTLGDATQGILTRTVFTPQVAQVKKVAGQVNELYKKKTGIDLSGPSARSFTGLQAWVHVLEKAGSTEPKAIQAAANAITIPGEQLVVPWFGIKFATMGEDIGQNTMGTGMIGQYQKKGDKISLEIVYPFELATSNLIYPFKGF